MKVTIHYKVPSKEVYHGTQEGVPRYYYGWKIEMHELIDVIDIDYGWDWLSVNFDRGVWAVPTQNVLSVVQENDK